MKEIQILSLLTTVDDMLVAAQSCSQRSGLMYLAKNNFCHSTNWLSKFGPSASLAIQDGHKPHQATVNIHIQDKLSAEDKPHADSLRGSPA